MNINKIIKAVNNIAYMIFFMIVISKIGETGAGIFSAALIVLYLLFSLIFGGTSDIVAKMVKNRIRRGFNDNAKKVFSYSTVLSLVVSGLLLLLLVFAGDKIVMILFGEKLSGSLMTLIGALLVINCICSNLRGYYIGCGGHIVMIIAEIVKDIILIALSPFAINYFLEYGTKVSAIKNDTIMTGLYGAIGAYLVMIIADIIMLLILISGMRSLMKQDNFSFNEVRSKDGFKSFLRSFLPVWIKKLQKNICPSIVIFFIGVVYIKSNIRIEIARDLIYAGFSKLLFGGFLLVVTALMIFEETAYCHYAPIKSDFRKEDRKSVLARFTTFTKAASVSVLPVFITLVAFNKPVCKLVFNNNFDDITALFIVSAFVFLVAAADKVLSIGLEAVNMSLSIFLGNVVGFIVQMVFVLAVSKTGLTITSAACGVLFYYIVCFVVHLVFALRDINLKLNDLLAKLIKVSIAALPMLVIDLILAKFVTMNYIIIVISVVVSYLIYSVILTAIRGMNQKDINSMQGSMLYGLFSILASVFHIR